MSVSLGASYADISSAIYDAENLSWVASYRQDAIYKLQDTRWPTRRHEDWKYTDLSRLAEIDFQLTSEESNRIYQADIATLHFEPKDSYRLVFINGQYSPQYSTIEALSDRLQICNLRQALIEQPNLLKHVFNQCVCDNKPIFSTLNTALFSDGAFIYIPDNVIVKQPIKLYFIANSHQQALVTIPRSLIMLGKHAQATVIENFHGFGEVDSFTNAMTEIETAEGAVLDYYKLQQQGNHGFHIGGTHIKQHGDSHVESYSIALGSTIMRNDVFSDLLGEGATINMNGFYKVSNKHHVDNRTLVNHAKASTQSTQNYRGILDDSARAIFNSAVIVQPGTKKIKAEQSNANLLLSNNAEVYTKPELQIYADDVECSHGATVGQLDENMLFYLRSRGIGKKDAKDLLILAFVNDIIKRIKFIPIRNKLYSDIVGSLYIANASMNLEEYTLNA